jgi:hypothetical protein
MIGLRERYRGLRATIAEGEQRTERRILQSQCHGPTHWRDVAHLGITLINLGVPADKDVVVAFAALHDTQRVNLDRDPKHGAKAAGLAHELWATGMLGWMSDRQMLSLVTALAIHNGAPPQRDPTIAACLDADRLTIGRTGRLVDPRELSCHWWLDTETMQHAMRYGDRLSRYQRGTHWKEDRWHMERSDSPPRVRNLSWEEILDEWRVCGATMAVA